MTEKGIINELAAQVPNRRSFMRKVGLASAALGTAAATRGMAQTSGPADSDILNFAESGISRGRVLHIRNYRAEHH